MTKGLGFDFIGLFTAILADCGEYFPNLQKEFERDLSRLIHLSQTRGESTFTIDLPTIGKLLDRSLSTGRLSFNGEPLSRSINCRTIIPRLFRGLWRELFDDSGCLRKDLDPNVVFFLRQLLYAGKKLRKECAPKYLYETTKEFHDVESELPPPSDFWDFLSEPHNRSDFGHLGDRNRGGGLLAQDSTTTSVVVPPGLFETTQRVADLVSAEFGMYMPSEFRFKHGPGAVSDAQVGVDYKYAFPTWNPNMEDVFPYDMFAVANASHAHECAAECDFVESSSVHIAVPKTQTGPRLIAKEPTCHQWAQQNISDFLRRGVTRGVLRYSIDFRDQERSRQAALRASRVGDMATMDLKSASDRVSCWLVQRVFRANTPLLHAMRACRTRYMSNGLDKKYDSLIRLRKFSTQGSALTFPVQSIFFAIVAISCVVYTKHVNRESITRNEVERAARQVRVFGDDLIVPVAVEPFVRALLHSLWLQVNLKKTHTEGYFRESCGMDAFRGYDVSPAYVPEAYEESKPSTIATVVDVHNNFVKKGLFHSAQWIVSTAPKWIRSKIPLVAPSSGAFGLVSYSGGQPTAVNRWNTELQKWQTRCLTLKDEAERTKFEGLSNLLQYFTEDPSPDILWESGLVGPSRLKVKTRWVDWSDLGILPGVTAQV